MTATDEEILAHAIENGQVIVSADTDFTILLAVSGATSPSLVLLRSADRLSPVDQSDLILANLLPVLEELAAGGVMSLSTTRLRVRTLPMR